MIVKVGSGLAALLLLVATLPRLDADEPGRDPADAVAMQTAVRADWLAQERRLGRTPQSPAAIGAAFERARSLLDSLRGIEGAPDLSTETDELQRLAERTKSVSSLGEVSRLDLYEHIRTLASVGGLSSGRL